MTLGERIQKKRKDLNLSQEALGEALGVTRQSISKWESDAAIPELDKLITLSRLFHVTVGELLGVEEGSPAREELTDRELKALEAIAARLTPPAPETPKKKRRWPKVLAVCAACIAVLAVAWSTAGRMERLEQQVNGLQFNVSAIDRNVSARVESIAGRVEELLEEQNRVAAEMGYVLADADPEAGTVTFRVWATPRTWREGMTAQFSARAVDNKGETSAEEATGTEGEGHRFEALVTCALTDDVTLSVTFVSGAESQNQVVGREEALYTNSAPHLEGNAVSSTFGHNLKEEKYSLGINTLDLFVEPGWLAAEKEELLTTVAECELRLWRGNEMVWSRQVDSLPDRGTHRELALGLNLPLPGLKEGENFYLSARFRDTAGRWFETLLEANRVSPRYNTGDTTDYILTPSYGEPENGYPWEESSTEE